MTKHNPTIIWLAVVGMILVVFAGVAEYQIYLTNQNLLKTNELIAQNLANVADKIQGLEDTDNTLASILDTQGKTFSSEITKIQEETEESSKQNEELRKQLASVEKDISSLEVTSGDFSSVIEDSIPAVVRVLTDVGQGSGFFVKESRLDDRNDGAYVVTNFHVIQGSSVIQIQTKDGKLSQGQLIGYQPGWDLALIRITENHPNLRLANSDKAKVGEKVIAVGNPLGFGFTVTEGIISQIQSVGGLEFIQHSVAINPGNSGGPLINTDGEIVGVNTFKVGGAEGLGFAIPSNRVKDFIDQIVASLEQQSSG